MLLALSLSVILLSMLKPSHTLLVIAGSSLSAIVGTGFNSFARGTSGIVSDTSEVGGGC